MEEFVWGRRAGGRAEAAPLLPGALGFVGEVVGAQVSPTLVGALVVGAWVTGRGTLAFNFHFLIAVVAYNDCIVS